MSDTHGPFGSLTRREFLAGSAALTAGTAGGLALWPGEAQVAELEKAGYTRTPVSCFVCGAGCGMLAMSKEGVAPSESSVRIMPNPSHPQRGYCGRGAASMWAWNHPLRLKKPMKRIGERGEGKFKEVSWDEALGEIAERLKKTVDEHGERAVVMTAHDLASVQQWFAYALGTPNVVGHQSTCNTAGIVARRWTFEKPFDSANRTEPDYANARYLLLVGRTLGCSMGVNHLVAQARERGLKVVVVDPRMPDMAFSDTEWVPIKPGTDTAFLLSLMQVMIAEKRVDAEFLAKHSNAAYLIKPDGRPLTQADMQATGKADWYAVWDAKSGSIAYQGVERDDKGKAVGFVARAEVEPALDYAGSVKLANGETVELRTAFAALTEVANKYPPAKAAAITGIPAANITKIARDFAAMKGVCDDSWYNSRNGNDFEACRSMQLMNAMVGNIDQKGGLVFSRSPGIGGGMSFDGKTGEVKAPNGQTWTIEEKKRIDTYTYPDAPGTFAAVIEAIDQGKPYPVKAVFASGTTLFHREANSERLAAALKKLDLFVVQDILPHEVIDHADFVLPATMFLERNELAGVKWALDASVHVSKKVVPIAPGVDARPDLWILLEILRRAYPDRAARVGYSADQTDLKAFAEFTDQLEEAALSKSLKKWAEQEPEVETRVRKELAEQGWSTLGKKKYGEYPYVKPLGTPSGKVEIYAFRAFVNDKLAKLGALPDYAPPPGYQLPTKDNEFYLVTGKNSAASSGTALFGMPAKFLGDRSLWIHPIDAARLGVVDGATIEIEGLDNGVKGRSQVKLTNRVMPGVLFAHGFAGGSRSKTVTDPRFAFVKEGVNSHWFATGYAQPVSGNLANNSSVRATKV
ncbi:MAG: molybdopterin-dependent oxidoreductase [Burkholderiaceae bacterium]